MTSRLPAVTVWVVVLLVTAGCRDGGADEADPPPRATAPGVAVVPTEGTRLSASAPALPSLSLGDSLVAVAAGATLPGHRPPLATPADGGRTWVPTEVPDADPGDLETWELSAVDGLGVLAGGRIGPDRFQGPPVLWVSDDDGPRSEPRRASPRRWPRATCAPLLAVDDLLVALGAIIPDGGFRSIPVTWTSDDRGRSWEREDHPELGPSGLSASSVAASGGRILATTATGPVASTDAGGTWDDVDAPVDPALTPNLEADGDVVVATHPAGDDVGALTAGVSSDGGRTWVRSAPLPEVPDRAGTGPTLSAPRHVRQVAEGALVAVASTVENNDLSLPYLVRSEDGGRTWAVADGPRDCIGGASIGPLAVMEDLAVAVDDCASPRRTTLLTSTDGGRTWVRTDDPALGDRLLGLPFPSGEHEVTLLAGRGAVVHVSVDS